MRNDQKKPDAEVSQAEENKVNAREARNSLKQTARNNVGTSQNGAERDQDTPASGKR